MTRSSASASPRFTAALSSRLLTGSWRWASASSLILETILTSLSKSVLSSAATAIFGKLLSDKDPTSEQLREIRAELASINAQLTQLHAQYDKLANLIAETHCAVLAGNLSTARADVDSVWRRYLSVSRQNPRPTRASVDALLRSIQAMGSGIGPERDIRLIHNTLARPSPGTQPLISVCGKVIQTHYLPFISTVNSKEVDQVVAFWQAYESQLTYLAVEELEAHGDTTGARDAIDTTQKNFAGEDKLRRPVLRVPDAFIDTRTNLLWIGPKVEPFGYTPGEIPFRTPTGIPASFPSFAQVHRLLHGWTGQSPQKWLGKKADVDWTVVNRYNTSALDTFTTGLFPEGRGKWAEPKDDLCPG